MDDFGQELVSTIKKFRMDKIEPLMEHDDADSKFRMEIFNEIGQLGLTGVTLPEQYGGAGLSYQNLCLI